MSEQNGTVKACPNCDGARLQTIVGGQPKDPVGTDPDATHWCPDCGDTVVAVERESYRRGTPKHGLAKRLFDADADELRTDGGETA